MSLKDSKVLDAETRAELMSIKNDIHTTVIETIAKEFRVLKEDISQLFNKDIAHHSEKLKEHDLKHKEHYDENDKRRDQIDQLKDYVIIEFGKVNNKIDTEIATQKTKDKEDEKNDRKQEVKQGGNSNTLTVIFGIIAALSVLYNIFLP